MLTQAGITSTKTKLQISVILISWSMVCAICGSVLVEKIGRRLQAMSCTIGMVCCLFIFGGLTKCMSSCFRLAWSNTNRLTMLC